MESTMNRDIVRVGVVGLGFGASVHGPAFASVDACHVVAIAGQNADKAKAAGAALGGAEAFSSWQAMLDGAALDAVCIAVPPALQPEIVGEAASRGLAVFCEKPISADEECAEVMVDAVARAGVPSAVNFWFPEIPAWQDAKRRIDDLAARGPLRSATLAWHVETYAHRHSLTDGWKRHPAQGGGALNSFVSHSIYYLEWLFGPLRRILARLTFTTNHDDSRVNAWLEFESGMMLSMSVAVDCPFGAGHRLEVYGENDAVILDNASKDYAKGFSLSPRGAIPTQGAPPHDDLDGVADGRTWATARIASRFVSHVRSGGCPIPNLAHGLRVQRVLAAFRRSHDLQQWIEAPRGFV